MDRFYNHDHVGVAAPVDWSDSALRVEEKVDGTLSIVYWDELVGWCVATRAVSEADVPISNDIIGAAGGSTMTFRKLFELAVREQFDIEFDAWAQRLDKGTTYCFELTTPFNQCIVEHDAARIWLLAVRDLRTGLEQDAVQLAERVDVPAVPRHAIACIQDAVALVETRSHKTHEGVVVVDGSWRRVKVKNSMHTLANHAKDVLLSSRREMLRHIFSGKIDELVQHVPSAIVRLVDEMRDKLDVRMKCLDEMARELKQQAPHDRRQFAGSVMLSGELSKPFFDFWEGRDASVTAWYQRMARAEKLSPSMLDQILSKLERPCK